MHSLVITPRAESAHGEQAQTKHEKRDNHPMLAIELPRVAGNDVDDAPNGIGHGGLPQFVTETHGSEVRTVWTQSTKQP
jgi:hypothetical protein